MLRPVITAIVHAIVVVQSNKAPRATYINKMPDQDRVENEIAETEFETASLFFRFLFRGSWISYSKSLYC